MTENKRFNLAYETNDQYCIWWAVSDGDITLWKEEVVTLLNNLSEENEELKKDVEFWKLLALVINQMYFEHCKKRKIIKRDYTSMGLYDSETENENKELKNDN